MLSSVDFHKDFKALRISTSEIGVKGVEFCREIAEEAFSALLHEPSNPSFAWQAAEPAKVFFRLERENDHAFRVNMQTSLVLKCSCVRCLKEIRFTYDFDDSICMLEMEHLGMSDQDAHGLTADSFAIDLSKEDEPLVGYFKDKCIDLALILRDQIFLTVPDYPHCALNKDALDASCGKGLLSAREGDYQSHNNPFVKRFGKAKS